jgi:hypothetical protein
MNSMQGLIPRYTTRYDIVEAWYWWLADHHRGIGSDEYTRLCKTGRYFKPGKLASGPDSEVAQIIYDTLCDDECCEHDRYQEDNEDD